MDRIENGQKISNRRRPSVSKDIFEITVIKLFKIQTLYVMNICSESLICKLIYEKQDGVDAGSGKIRLICKDQRESIENLQLLLWYVWIDHNYTVKVEAAVYNN